MDDGSDSGGTVDALAGAGAVAVSSDSALTGVTWECVAAGGGCCESGGTCTGVTGSDEIDASL